MTSPSLGTAGSTLRKARQVTVAVPTYHRPEQLGRLLRAVMPQLVEVAEVLPHPDAADILIVDNDPGGSASEVVRHSRTEALLGDRLRYVVETTPGVSAVRNRALGEVVAGPGHLLVFIDDDEVPRPGWLLELVHLWMTTHAAAVSGPVVTTWDDDSAPDPWLIDGEFFEQAHRRDLGTGALIDRAATNNLLLDLSVIRRLGLVFDVGLGLSGGEDSVFTSQLVGSGETILWCAEAVVEDRLSPERLTRESALSRTRNAAHSGALADLVLVRGSLSRARTKGLIAIRGIVRLAQGLVHLTRFRLTRAQRDDAVGQRALARGRGELTAVLGRRSTAYAYGRTTEQPSGV